MPLQTPAEPKKHTTVYSDFRGVDFTNDPSTVFRRRSPYAVNILPDVGGIPYKRTGWRVEHISSDKKPIRNMWSFDFAETSHLLYVEGDKVMLLGDEAEVVSLSSDETEVTGVYFNSMSGGKFYLLADSKLMEFYQNDGFKAKEVDAYVPTVLIGRTPTGGGTMYENVNLLTRRRVENFLGDSTLEYFVSSPIDTEASVIVKVKNEAGEYETLASNEYTVGEISVTFTSAKPPVVTGEDNVQIEYTASVENEAANAIRKCTVASVYNNRVFLAGTTGTLKSRVWYSAYANPAYFPDLSYFVVGDDYGGVMGLIDLGEYLGVIKESNPKDSTVYLAYPVTLDKDSAYAVKQSITGVGALSKQTFYSLNGEQLFLSDDGIYGIMADMQSSEVASSFVKNRSYYINGKLLEEPNLDKAIAIVWNGFYVLCVNGHCYLLDSTQKSSWATERTNMQYEAYYWENVPATAFCIYDDTLYFGTNDGRICHFKSAELYGAEAYNDDGAPIKCEWRTILDSDGAVNFYKNLQKKGCVVVLQGVKEGMTSTSAEIYIKADDNPEEYVGSMASEQTNIPNEFYLNKKVKKYKRLQFIIRNDILNEAFGVQEITKVYTVGNYSKNKGNDTEIYTLFVDGKSDLHLNGYGIEGMSRTEKDGKVILSNPSFSIEYNTETGELYYID